VLVAAFGCSSGDRPIAIRGKVTFQGQPVSEGTVQFNDEKTGHGPAGDYTVLIVPPMLAVESKGGPPDPQFKKVRNIPNKYRSTGGGRPPAGRVIPGHVVTSGLRVTVSADKTLHDFDMEP
jgi:hypothetical protein